MRTYYLTKIDDTPAGMHPDLPLQRAIEKKNYALSLVPLDDAVICKKFIWGRPNWQSLYGGVVALNMGGTWAILAIGVLIRVTVHLAHEVSMGLGGCPRRL